MLRARCGALIMKRQWGAGNGSVALGGGFNPGWTGPRTDRPERPYRFLMITLTFIVTITTNNGRR